MSLGLSPASRANEVIGNVFFENRSSDVVNDIDPKDNSQAHSGRLVAAYIINDLKTGTTLLGPSRPLNQLVRVVLSFKYE